MWLTSDVPEAPEDYHLIKRDNAEALYSPEKSSIHAIRTEDNKVEQDMVCKIIQIAKP